MISLDELIIKAKQKEIKYPILRQGETFVDERIFLYLYKENSTIPIKSKLYNNIETALIECKSTLEKGFYFIQCKEAKEPWIIKFEI
ncbi:hypothetical protein [Clostridium thermobutyricum]|uniref:hypothetical protein n=1 Tax=Clostridium thermobutyricum TaxID=29372 RepID=UPI0018AB26B2|nr:hypothetical protein [Clostridium thermobutyricum]